MEDMKLYAMLGATMQDKNGKEVKKIVTVPHESIPEGLMPANSNLYKIARPELKDLVFYGYKGTIPPEYIKAYVPLDVDVCGDPKEANALYTRPYFYPAKEAEKDEIEKNGIPGEKITLAETPEEAAYLGAMKYKTKENKIKTLALVIVNIPIGARLEEATVETPTGDILNTVEVAQAIPAEWISETAFIDFREGGLFA